MKARLVLCLIVLLWLFHSIQASQKDQEFTGGVLQIVNVPGRIDPQLQSIQRERSTRAINGGYPWEMRPEIFAFTGAPQWDLIGYPAEFDRTAEIVLGWPSYAFDNNGRLKISELLEIVRHSVGTIKVSMFMEARTKGRVEKTLRAAGLDPLQVEMITFPKEFPDSRISNTVDTIWMKDFGPQFVYAKGFDDRMKLNVIDMSYLPFPWSSRSNPLGRVRDDALPTRFASHRGFPVHRPQLIAEGGDFMTDGKGTCFVSDRLPGSNTSVFGSDHHWEDVLSQFYGCRRTILLTGLKEEATGHLDMFMTVLSPTTIFVGKYNHSQDSVNARRLNSNADKLTAMGYKVVRIPMPAPYSIVFQRIWATYTNVVRINDKILVPVYRNPNFPPHLRDVIQKQEAEALKKYREALPGVTVIPIPADSLIPAGGSLHCIVVNLPAWKTQTFNTETRSHGN